MRHRKTPFLLLQTFVTSSVPEGLPLLLQAGIWHRGGGTGGRTCHGDTINSFFFQHKAKLGVKCQLLDWHLAGNKSLKFRVDWASSKAGVNTKRILGVESEFRLKRCPAEAQLSPFHPCPFPVLGFVLPGGSGAWERLSFVSTEPGPRRCCSTRSKCQEN